MPTARELLPASSATEEQFQLIKQLTASCPQRDFAVRLWDGSLWGETQQPRFTLVLRRPESLYHLLTATSELELGEAFIFELLDVEGDLEAAFAFADGLLARQSATDKLKLAAQVRKLPRGNDGHHATTPRLWGLRHARFRDRSAVTYHYDVSNDFFRLWLDRLMVYSCAYFRRGDEDIEEAQQNKLAYICRKLRLRVGDRLLDIGCGWGGLILYAAEKFGVHALGITLSEPQAELARERIAAAGLADRCEVRVCDYRDLEPQAAFDKIVSVGMVEHVGESHLPRYFQQAWSLLRPGGVFLNHGIAASATFRRKGESFIDRYVFPDGELVPLGTMIRNAEACGLEVRDIECLREQYAQTLRCWVRRLEVALQRSRPCRQRDCLSHLAAVHGRLGPRIHHWSPECLPDDPQ